MLNVLRRGGSGPESVSPTEGWRPPADVVWLDLFNPSREEEVAVEAALGLGLPTREEMAEIEPSSRLYQAHGATFMTATLLARREGTPSSKGGLDREGRANAPVTFVLTAGLLVTIRYDELKAFNLFAERAQSLEVASGASCLFNLLDAVVERLADLLEHTGADVEVVSTAIFSRPKGAQFEALLTDLARAQSLTSLTRNSLVSLSRVFSFAALAPEIRGDPACQAPLRTLQRDGRSLTEHAGFQSARSPSCWIRRWG